MSDQSTSSAGNATARFEASSQVGEETKTSFMSAGGLLGALAMTSCCIMPLALFSLGVTGAWIGNLAALYPYKWAFFLVTAGFLGFGFHRVYRRPKIIASETGSYCGSPRSDRINKIALWSATLITAVAMAFPYIAPVLLES